MLKLFFDVDLFTTYFAIMLGILALLYFFWDVNYYLRVIITIAWSRLFLEKSKVEETLNMYSKLLIYFGLCLV